MRSTRIGATLAGALMAGSLLRSTAIAQSPEMPTGEMSAEDRAAIDAVAAGMLESAAELPAVYLGVWDPERGAYGAPYGTTTGPAPVAGRSTTPAGPRSSRSWRQ